MVKNVNKIPDMSRSMPNIKLIHSVSASDIRAVVVEILPKGSPFFTMLKVPCVEEIIINIPPIINEIELYNPINSSGTGAPSAYNSTNNMGTKTINKIKVILIAISLSFFFFEQAFFECVFFILYFPLRFYRMQSA